MPSIIDAIIDALSERRTFIIERPILSYQRRRPPAPPAIPPELTKEAAIELVSKSDWAQNIARRLAEEAATRAGLTGPEADRFIENFVKGYSRFLAERFVGGIPL